MENLIVYGARCVWWDSINKAGQTPPRNGYSLPCCPHCSGVLFQQTEEEWWEGVRKYEADGHKGYKDFVDWWRGKCFPTFADAKRSYKLNHMIFDLDVLRWIDEP